MKNILLAIIIFISSFSVGYAQCIKANVSIAGSSSISICEGEILTLSSSAIATGASQNGGFMYSWQKSTTTIIQPTDITLPANVSTTIPDFTINAAAIADAGTYILRVEDGNVGNAACYTEASVVVTVNPKPTISGDLTICSGSTTQLIGSGTPYTTAPWTSATTSVATLGAITGLVTGIASGTSVVTYTTAEGCTQTATVTVNPKPSIYGTLNVCEGSTRQLTGSGTPATTDAWTSASPNIATVDNTGLVTGIASGTSIITYTNSNACEQIAVVTVNPIPTISGNLITCNGSTTQLTGSGTPSTTMSWVSATTTVATVTHTGVVTGVSSGTSVITYTNSNGCTQRATVTVNPFPSITGTLYICLGSTTQLIASGTPAATDAWTSASPTVATVDNNGLVTGLATGTSVIKYTNTNGCSMTTTVTVGNKVSITTNPGSTICSGTSVTFKAIGFLGGAPTFEWSSSVTGVITETTDTYTNNNLTDGEVISVKINNTVSNCALPQSATNSITMHILPIGITPSVSITSDKTNICAGTPVTYTAIATNVILRPYYEWYTVSDGNEILVSLASLTSTFTSYPLEPGYTVLAKIISNDACANSAPISSSPLAININSPTTPGTIGTDPIICHGSTTTITELTISDASSPTYSWESTTNTVNQNWIGPSYESDSPDLTIQFNSNVDVYFRRIVTDASKPAPCNVAVTTPVSIRVVPCTPFSSNITGPNSITPGQQNVTYTVAYQTGFTYGWTITGGTITSGQNTNSITVNWDNTVSSPMVRTTSTSYSISVTETNEGNESHTTTLDLTTLTTGTILSQAQAGIKLFPNPTTGSFNIEMPESSMNVSYEILDLTGLSVANGTFTSTGSDQTIDTNLGAGMYQVVLKYNNVVTCVRLSKVQ